MPTTIGISEQRFRTSELSSQGVSIMCGWLESLYPSVPIILMGANSEYISIRCAGEDSYRDRIYQFISRGFEKAQTLFPARNIVFTRYRPFSPSYPPEALNVDWGY